MHLGCNAPPLLLALCSTALCSTALHPSCWPTLTLPRCPAYCQILDIGGGFCGGRFGRDGRVDLGGVPEAVNSALAAHFPEDGEPRSPAHSPACPLRCNPIGLLML